MMKALSRSHILEIYSLQTYGKLKALVEENAQLINAIGIIRANSNVENKNVLSHLQDTYQSELSKKKAKSLSLNVFKFNLLRRTIF